MPRDGLQRRERGWGHDRGIAPQLLLSQLLIHPLGVPLVQIVLRGLQIVD